MKSIIEYINEAKGNGALSISKLNKIIISNINSVNDEILKNTDRLDLNLFLKDGQEFRFIELPNGDSEMTGYFGIPEEFITHRGNRYVGDYLKYYKLNTLQKKDFVAWISNRKYELFYSKYELTYSKGEFSYSYCVAEVGAKKPKGYENRKYEKKPIDLFKIQ